MKTKEQYEIEILEVIKKEKIFLITDIFAFYKGCSRSTFYGHQLDKMDTIKNAIDENKISTKYQIMSKWSNSDNATLQLALFKILCTDDERKKLSLTYQQIEPENKPKEIDLSKIPDDILEDIVASLKE